MENETLAAAEILLQEAVYRSRGKQAGMAALAPLPAANLEEVGGPGNCGLGLRAQVDLQQSEVGQKAFRHLFPQAPDPELSERLEDLLATWVKRQDALDRKRNHFLRDFREAHGYDRRAYTAEQNATYNAGVEAVNAEENAGRLQAQQGLLELAQATPK